MIKPRISNKKSKKANNYAFIDSQNLNMGTQRMGWKLDWRKFRRYLEDKYNVTHAYMFIGYMSENESLYEYMHELGYLVVLKPTIDLSNNEAAKQAHAEKIKFEESKDPSHNDSDKDKEKEKDKPLIKGNVDAELVLYAMKEINNYDKAIIVSGDGDFFSLAEYLDEENKLDHIIAPNWQYSSLLKVYENKIIRLDKLRKQLTYHSKKSK
jgi:uncharacterized LabA/DUF88 family protein